MKNKFFTENLNKSEDFPTPEFPIITNLNK